MVKFNSIVKAIDDYVQKCHDYPKATAMRNFDPNNFMEERWSENPEKIPSPQGTLQRVQEELQGSINYTNLEKGALGDYKTNSFLPLNYWLNGGKLPTNERELERLEWEIGFHGYMRGEDGELLIGDDDNAKGELVMPVHNYTVSWENREGHEYVDLSMPQEDELIKRAIDKSPKLQQDTVLYSYRELPLDLKEGDHGVIKGYGSTSFNPYVIDDIMNNGQWVQGQKDRRLRCKIYAPKGTDGIVLNRQVSGSLAWQSEWLLNKNQRYFVRSINYETMEAEIVLY